jgi:hypothetical protein
MSANCHQLSLTEFDQRWQRAVHSIKGAVMSKWSSLAFAGLVTLAVTLAPSVPVAAAATPTTLSADVVDTSGSAVSGVEVDVFYVPFTDATGTPPATIMGSGVTATGGAVNIPLSDTMLQQGDLAPDDSGVLNQFNAMVCTASGGEPIGCDADVMTDAAANSDTMTVPSGINTTPIGPGVSKAKARSATTSPVPTLTIAPDAVTSTSGPNTQFREVPVDAMNVANGMTGTFDYTTSTSTKRALKVTVAINKGGGWGVGGYQEEEQSRAGSAPWTESGSYHYEVWANYQFDRKVITFCASGHGVGFCAVVGHYWVPDKWSGTLTDNNPNESINGGTIGQRASASYTWPPSNKNFAVKLSTSGQTGFSRNTTNNQTIGFALDEAPTVDSIVTGGINLTAEGSWNTISTQSWKATSGCSGTTWLWAPNGVITTAPQIEAICTSTPV